MVEANNGAPVQPRRSLARQIINLRWVSPFAIFGLAALHQLVLHVLQPRFSTAYHPWLAILLYGFTGSVAVWYVLGWLAQSATRQEQIEAELRDAYQSLAETHRQLLAVHEMGREIASAEDMQRVLELAAQAPTHLAHATGAAVLTFDEEKDRLRLDIAWGLSEAHVRTLRERAEAGIPAERCRTCEPLKARVSSDCPLFEGMQELARAQGIQSLVCLPITRDQKREGIITAYFPSPDGPPEEQVRWLNIVATEIAAALDGLRLRERQMATLYAVENLTQGQQELTEVLHQVLEASLAGWGSSCGAILLYDEEGKAWYHWVQRGLGDDSKHPRFSLAIRLAEEASQRRKPFLIPDLTKYSILDASELDGLKSAAAAPLLIGEQRLGALVMASERANAFRPRYAPFLAAVAHQAALAVYNAQLHLQVQQMAVLEERYRLSREMHDGLAQTLGSLGWQLDHLKMLLERRELEAMERELANTRQTVREAYMDVREAIDGLRLATDHPGGLTAALTEYVADFEHRTGIITHLEIDDGPYALSPEAELHLLRIVQEGLTNVRKHAAAHHVWVRLQHVPGRIELTVADDGKGFDPHLPRGRQHVGLASMRERALSLGGTLTLVSSPGRGTRINVVIPTEKGEAS